MFGLGGSKSAVGLDIGASSIKFAHLKKSGNEAQLMSFGVAELPHEGVIVDGAIVDQNAIAEVIKEFFKTSRIKAGNVVAGLSNQNVISRFIKVPIMSENELDEAIKYEAEQYVPYALEDMNLSYHKLSIVEDEGMQQNLILLVCVQKEFVNNFMATLKTANVVPHVLDIDNIAIINALEAQIRADEVTAIIDMGAGSTNINIVKDRVLKFTRNIPIAGNNITSVIQNVLKLDYEQAQAIKHEEGVVMMEEEGEANEVSEVVRTIIEELASEIRRSFDYYKAQYREQTIHRILLSGGSAKLKNLDVFLANELGIEVELGNPLNGVSANVPNADQLQDRVLELTAAIGMALREVVD
jgi:type IV pilus assembly protein PilM